MMSESNSFQSVRDLAAKFCADREWKQFHTPTNLALALAGECGEVCEIFQWKGSLEKKTLDDLKNHFSEKELTNIGEEIADVFIYSTRLAEVSHIDLAHAVRKICELPVVKQSSFTVDAEAYENNWEDLTFTELAEKMTQFCQVQKSQRHIAFSLQVEVGKLCSLFQNKHENENLVGLSAWSEENINELAVLLGTICILLSCLATTTGHTLEKCISDKMKKNNAKYPADMVRGSSAKFTEYRDKIRSNADKRSGASVDKINNMVKIVPYLVFLVGVVALVLGYALAQVVTFQDLKKHFEL